ncbi:MAG TPA: carbon monoxide dehydrogenase subunit G [Pyrinomonadaceae bacterium]|nr:carbon monoxide dehydrogenase subunit G [Pyrinomonadaceae bacterium]
MKIEGSHQISAARTRVYDALINPEVLKRVIPGCERLELTGENTFAATIRTGVGAIKGVFNGNVRLEDLRAPEHFRMVVDGKGAPGFLKGSGDLDLKTNGEATIVDYTGEVQVGGTIASVGQRMIQGTVKMMATQFFTALEAEARVAEGEHPPKHDFFRTALRWFSGWIKRLLGR